MGWSYHPSAKSRCSGEMGVATSDFTKWLPNQHHHPDISISTNALSSLRISDFLCSIDFAVTRRP
jgi:hypothetical protein